MQDYCKTLKTKPKDQTNLNTRKRYPFLILSDSSPSNPWKWYISSICLIIHFFEKTFTKNNFCLVQKSTEREYHRTFSPPYVHSFIFTHNKNNWCNWVVKLDLKINFVHIQVITKHRNTTIWWTISYITYQLTTKIAHRYFLRAILSW